LNGALASSGSECISQRERKNFPLINPRVAYHDTCKTKGVAKMRKQFQRKREMVRNQHGAVRV